MDLFTSPLFERLKDAEHVLIAGAGGGFDVFSGLPLFFRLRELGKKVSLANLSFTRLEMVEGRLLAPGLMEVDGQTPGPVHYFPEGLLSRWFQDRGEHVPIYCFVRTGVAPLRAAYEALREKLGFDTVVLVDGGTDILMRGDEVGLGTPEEDITSLAVVDSLPLRDKLVVCLGFGVDFHHGVCHAHFLESVAALSKQGAYLGVTALLPPMPEVALYREAVEYVCERMPRAPSIVSLSVVTAIEGEYGNVHRTVRTEGSKLWINPLMSMYWAFDLTALARRCLYLEQLRDTQTSWEVSERIEAFRNTHSPIRPWVDIPV
ncbi:DUF1152 domain-containing protein [Pyxidicoccus fallax]|uniref:DUF1152 domain-containing protein n=1 Tax=Pyxidicoccus fallax TaxID=394095 RepID=A0A848LCG6_9BACT|nr:DUF1152 domain-containing protein [Pyxidicoccus fallax]NMO16367.1 DUF1152 domain-containing protein [Pyxidicoccus fallax]NPC78171.1 DUF1152 domain-containing protein [Pyxidicoccus fallax]